MLEDTLERLAGLAAPRDTWILTAADLRDAVRSAVPGVPEAQVVGEPVGKNTAPAIALASWWLRGSGADAVIAVLPSDHRIEPAARLRRDLESAAREALERKAIVVLGIPPTRAETGFGYIQMGPAVGSGSAVHAVAAFREKPDAATAARYAGDGHHLWNAGMFVFPPQVMLEELREHAPDIASLLPALPDEPGPGSGRALERFYGSAPAISIDYAVMERTRRALVARAGFHWDDLGSWAAIAETAAADEAGNVTRGRSLLHDCRRVIAFSDGGLVAAVGVEDLVIVRTSDVTLVCPRSRAQEVRGLVERLKADGGAGEFL
jgi:mannose-1-phosphate guanylyltransferase/mannose-6-phosphate isomerase